MPSEVPLPMLCPPPAPAVAPEEIRQLKAAAWHDYRLVPDDIVNVPPHMLPWEARELASFGVVAHETEAFVHRKIKEMKEQGYTEKQRQNSGWVQDYYWWCCCHPECESGFKLQWFTTKRSRCVAAAHGGMA